MHIFSSKSGLDFFVIFLQVFIHMWVVKRLARVGWRISMPLPQIPRFAPPHLISEYAPAHTQLRTYWKSAVLPPKLPNMPLRWNPWLSIKKIPFYVVQLKSSNKEVSTDTKYSIYGSKLVYKLSDKSLVYVYYPQTDIKGASFPRLCNCPNTSRLGRKNGGGGTEGRKSANYPFLHFYWEYVAF